MAFLTCVVGSALDNANGDGNAKSPPHNGSRVHWERGMTLAAAVNHGGELEVMVMLFLFLFIHLVAVLWAFFGSCCAAEDEARRETRATHGGGK